VGLVRRAWSDTIAASSLISVAIARTRAMFIGGTGAGYSGGVKGGIQIKAELIKRAFEGGCGLGEGKTELRGV
jgi:hypothetical protein